MEKNTHLASLYSAQFTVPNINTNNDVDAILELLIPITNTSCPEVTITVCGVINDSMVKELECKLKPFNHNATVTHVSWKSATGDWFPQDLESHIVKVAFNEGNPGLGPGVD